MLKKENNQLVDITNISESLNIQRDTRQYSEQTKALVPLNNPLGSTHVTHTVSDNDVCYIGVHAGTRTRNLLIRNQIGGQFDFL